jgi:glycosyltransferase involved in cell wall biosynthesis
MVDEEQQPQLLFCGFCGVPGTSANGARLYQMIASIPDDFLVDAIATRGPDEPHIERVGSARLMRVPIGDDFEDALAAYQRGLQRQITSDSYDLVYCADIFSAQIAAALKESQEYSLVIEVNDLPASSFHRRYPVSARDKKLRKQWHAAERAVLRAADRVVGGSRRSARLLAELVDPRKVELVARAVDRSLYTPPTVQIALDDRKTVVVFGGPEGRESTRSGQGIVDCIAQLVDPEEVRVAWVGKPSGSVAVPQGVDLVPVDGPARVASTLADADVVVIPTAADAGAELWGTPHRALEAMSCGRATVVIGEAKSFSDVITHDENAIVVSPGAAEDIAAQAVELLGDDERRERLGRAAVRAIEEHADLDAQRERFAALISDLVGVSMKIRAGEQTTPFETTRVQPPLITAALPPPPVIDIKTADIVPLDVSEGYDDEDAFEMRPTDVESRPNVIPKVTTKPDPSADTAVKAEKTTGETEQDVTAPSESITPELPRRPVGARSLLAMDDDEEEEDADNSWDGPSNNQIETEILERTPSMDASLVDTDETERNAPSPAVTPEDDPEVSAKTFATLQAIQAEVDDAASDNPWGADGGDTIADAAPLQFESFSGRNPLSKRKAGLLADEDPPTDSTVDDGSPLAEHTSDG